MILEKKTIYREILIILAVFAAFVLSCRQPENTTPVTDGTVAGYQKISATRGNFGGTLDVNDYIGNALTSLGDLDGNGVAEIAVGSKEDDDGGDSRGAVWILYLRTDGTVKGRQKISSDEGEFTGTLENLDYFGYSLASPGDVNDDGISDLAVGAYHDDDGGNNRGAVWILFLENDGTVQGYQKISDTEGGFGGIIEDWDRFGTSIASLGDLNGDGNPDLAVGAAYADGGGTYRGSVWILFLNSSGLVLSWTKIGDGSGGFTGTLENNDYFGHSLASIGDVNDDGTIDLAIGAIEDDDGGSNRGAVWLLFLNSDGTVKGHQKISSTAGNFGGLLSDNDNFGNSATSPGDLDNNGTPDLVVGARYDDRVDSLTGVNQGSVWVLFLNNDGTVLREQKINGLAGSFTGTLDDEDLFGASVVSPGDINGDAIPDLVVGAMGDDDGVDNAGAVWVLFPAAESGE